MLGAASYIVGGENLSQQWPGTAARWVLVPAEHGEVPNAEVNVAVRLVNKPSVPALSSTGRGVGRAQWGGRVRESRSVLLRGAEMN